MIGFRLLFLFASLLAVNSSPVENGGNLTAVGLNFRNAHFNAKMMRLSVNFLFNGKPPSTDNVVSTTASPFPSNVTVGNCSYLTEVAGQEFRDWCPDDQDHVCTSAQTDMEAGKPYTACCTYQNGTQDCRNWCFPENALVYVIVANDNLRATAMKDLRIGDMILSNFDHSQKPMYSRVVNFIHYEPSTAFNGYLEVCTQSQQEADCLVLSPDHFIYSLNASAFVEAATLQQDDLIRTFQGIPTRITSIRRVAANGIYAPLTESGTMVVNGAVVSCYASAPSHQVAHFGLAPLRRLSSWTLQEGSQVLPSFEGKHPFAKFLEDIQDNYPVLAGIYVNFITDYLIF